MRSKMSRPRVTMEACPVVNGLNEPAKNAVRGECSDCDFCVIFYYEVVDDEALAFHGVFAHVEFQ